MPRFELEFLTLQQPIEWSKYSPQPTACLMVVDNPVSDALLASVVTGAANSGCTFFVLWGAMADNLHDRIDEILEDGSDDWLGIITTSHLNESSEDVSDFLFTATLPGRDNARFLVIGDRSVEQMKKQIDSSRN